jgi:hypothetical protein
MKSLGYSQTTLAKKLGLKEGFKIRIVHAPDYYFDLFTDLPSNLEIVNDPSVKKNFIHYFAWEAKTLENEILSLKEEIVDNGILWVSWHKKSSKIQTDVTETLVRELALASGLVDIKVYAVDDVWSGLKLVVPVKSRASGY